MQHFDDSQRRRCRVATRRGEGTRQHGRRSGDSTHCISARARHWDSERCPTSAPACSSWIA
eukprot:9648043-Alexandrium_andersonii.AAC.1